MLFEEIPTDLFPLKIKNTSSFLSRRNIESIFPYIIEIQIQHRFPYLAQKEQIQSFQNLSLICRIYIKYHIHDTKIRFHYIYGRKTYLQTLIMIYYS